MDWKKEKSFYKRRDRIGFYWMHGLKKKSEDFPAEPDFYIGK
jgi:hypothetical protein